MTAKLAGMSAASVAQTLDQISALQQQANEAAAAAQKPAEKKTRKARPTVQPGQAPGADEEYTVSRIVDHKVDKGVIYFLVEWEGYDSSNNTWEPRDNLRKTAQESITDYLVEKDFVIRTIGGEEAILPSRLSFDTGAPAATAITPALTAPAQQPTPVPEAPTATTRPQPSPLSPTQ